MRVRRDLFIERPPKTDDPKVQRYLEKLDMVLRQFVREVSDDILDIENQIKEEGN